jgi:hypothetical protein
MRTYSADNQARPRAAAREVKVSSTRLVTDHKQRSPTVENHPISRRGFVGTCAAIAASASPGVSLAAAAEGQGKGQEERRTFRLKETAGLRRFGYPVHTILPGAPASTKFRLERDGKPISAQFRQVPAADGAPSIALDFNASPGPLETETYTVRSGTGVIPGPEPKSGMSVEHVGDVFRVSNASVLLFSLADHLGGFLRAVRNASLDFMADSGSGLAITDTKGRSKSVGTSGRGTADADFRGTVIRAGPMSVGLRFAGSTKLEDLGAVRSVVDLTFPNSKSWVEARWTIEDPDGIVGALGVQLQFKLEGEPIVLDFGASNTVYGSVRARESMALVAGDIPGLASLGSAWRVWKMGASAASTFASAVSRDAHAAEGWAHVMDRQRCSAVAVAGFGRGSRDELRFEATGTLMINRRFPLSEPGTPRTPKTLRFWVHFVTNPVQIGAVTSPQAMLAPLEVDWESANIR